ncbi:MAG: NAD-dependent succinate-semialdehyde dehydrogenase [Verrucomicrobiae bacterium]|nr:NAD-dependent succinate-semialdehyde dehydrogenase [Verrucomicrobiae bacterium]MDW8308769.1 NAD-dependent succinate-semialdehyde dehydrogenase [Verrucomicrobiales bacterium]
MFEPLGGWIDGRWITRTPHGTFDVRNPATGERLATLPVMADAETVAAIEAAERAWQIPAPLEARRAWLEGIRDRLLAHRETLARTITLENGKPLREARAEVEYAAGFFGFFATQLHRLEPETWPGPPPVTQWTVLHSPAGVVGLITPWNFPLAMLAKKFAAALAAGCAAVIKPALPTPLSAIALARLAEQSGVPPGRVNLLLGPPEPIGAVLCRHPAVRLISFTGSTAVGRRLLAATAPHVKRLALELGGHAPFLVFEDADLPAALDALIANKFRAGGQTCICTNRVYVHQSIAEPFLNALAHRVAQLRVGNGLDPQTDIGPLIHRAAFDKVAAHVRDALERGAQRLVGHDPPRPEHDWGAFYPPTVLSRVTTDMLVCREETFGPVVPVATFETEEDAIAAANNTPYGLAAYFFTRDPARARRCIARLRFGHIGWNTGSGPRPETPFGGMKQSGFGREGGWHGLLEFCEPQVVARAHG